MATIAELLAAAQAALQAGRLADAQQRLREVVALEGGHVAARHALGATLAQQGRLDEAIAELEIAFKQSPALPGLARDLRTARASRETERAIRLLAERRRDEALDALRRALEIDPDYAPALGNLGNVLKEQGELDEAARAYERVLALAPGSADALYSLGLVAREQERFEDAADWCRRALALREGFVDAHYTLGTALLAQNRLEGAVASFRRAVELAPDYAIAHMGLAFSLFAEGRLAEGWVEYEWRLRDARMAEEPLDRPRWSGEPLAGRTILLRCEQGFGDSLHFVRYAEVLQRAGATVLVLCRRPLARILATARGVDRVVCTGEALPEFDFYIPLLSVPGVVGTTLESIPANIPYLQPDAALVEPWKGELRGTPGLKVGISWHSDPNHPVRNRRIPLVHFAGVARTPGVQVYSLQFGAGREQLEQLDERLPIVDLGDRLGDFHNTAAIVRNLDLVITCDSAPAHVAGALGVPTWVALPFSPDWRWMLDRSDTPWYPTMRLFRQPKQGDWQSVFVEIEQELAR